MKEKFGRFEKVFTLPNRIAECIHRKALFGPKQHPR
jgi:hypothetical protein